MTDLPVQTTTAERQAARAWLYQGERAMVGSYMKDEALQYHVSREPGVLQRYEVRSLAAAMAGKTAPVTTEPTKRIVIEGRGIRVVD